MLSGRRRRGGEGEGSRRGRVMLLGAGDVHELKRDGPSATVAVLMHGPRGRLLRFADVCQSTRARHEGDVATDGPAEIRAISLRSVGTDRKKPVYLLELMAVRPRRDQRQLDFSRDTLPSRGCRSPEPDLVRAS